MPMRVGSTALVVRSSRRTPSVSSNWRICFVSAGCERCSRRAARVKLPSLATVTKLCSWRRLRSIKLITAGYYFYENNSILLRMGLR